MTLDYSIVRKQLFGGKISTKQFEGIEAILSIPVTDKRYMAYMLATAYHETARTMQPIAEYGKGKGHTYGRVDKATNKAYYGRGLVQLTHKYNYEIMGRLLGLDLVNKPDLLLTMEVSVMVMFTGMTKGVFTGKKLSDYFTKSSTDYIGARFIINGKRKKTDKYADKAELIASQAKIFFKALLN